MSDDEMIVTGSGRHNDPYRFVRLEGGTLDMVIVRPRARWWRHPIQWWRCRRNLTIDRTMSDENPRFLNRRVTYPMWGVVALVFYVMAPVASGWFGPVWGGSLILAAIGVMIYGWRNER